MHPNEALRTTNSGKLLLLAHPDATLLIGGLPAHEAILRELVRSGVSAAIGEALPADSSALAVRLVRVEVPQSGRLKLHLD